MFQGVKPAGIMLEGLWVAWVQTHALCPPGPWRHLAPGGENHQDGLKLNFWCPKLLVSSAGKPSRRGILGSPGFTPVDTGKGGDVAHFKPCTFNLLSLVPPFKKRIQHHKHRLREKSLKETQPLLSSPRIPHHFECEPL